MPVPFPEIELDSPKSNQIEYLSSHEDFQEAAAEVVSNNYEDISDTEMEIGNIDSELSDVSSDEESNIEEITQITPVSSYIQPADNVIKEPNYFANAWRSRLCE